MRNRTRAVHVALAAVLIAPLIKPLIAPLMAAGRSGESTRADSVLTARHFNQGASMKVFNPTGAVRLVGWNHDSLEVRGNVSPRKRYFASGDANGMKLGVDEARVGEAPVHGDITVYLPRGTQVAVKTVNGDIDAADVSGWFYTIAGAVRIGGNATSIEVDAMRGDIDLGVSVPWLHVRAGSGHVVVHGVVQDVDVSTISGMLDVASSGIRRGQFSSVSGDIHWVGAPPVGAILDFSNHSGAVDIALPRSALGSFLLSTVAGTITNGFMPLRPVSQEQHSVRLTRGRGGADVTVRTFKGTIRVRPE